MSRVARSRHLGAAGQGRTERTPRVGIRWLPGAVMFTELLFMSLCILLGKVAVTRPDVIPEHLSATNQNGSANAAGPRARNLNDAREKMREVPSGKMLTMVDVTLGASSCDCIVSENCTAATACPPFAQALIAEL
jgi:hypothetical protein